MALTVVAAIMLWCGVSAVCGGVYRFNLPGDGAPNRRLSERCTRSVIRSTRVATSFRPIAIDYRTQGVGHQDGTNLTRRHAMTDIARYIETRYYPRRRHSAIGYRPPNEVHDACQSRQPSA